MSLNQEDARRNALAHRLYKATKPKNTALPITYTNATTVGRLKAIFMASPRADADNHLSHASRGLSAQVKRA